VRRTLSLLRIPNRPIVLGRTILLLLAGVLTACQGVSHSVPTIAPGLSLIPANLQDSPRVALPSGADSGAIPSQTPLPTQSIAKLLISPPAATASAEQVILTPSRLVYTTQVGDTLMAVARRFRVTPQEIVSTSPLSQQGLLDRGQVLSIPSRLTGLAPVFRLLPDNEIVYGPSAADFDVAAYLKHTDGFLKNHREYLKSTGWNSAAEIIERVALENSINPRLLLALLEFKCGCVLGQPDKAAQVDYLLGNTDFRRKGLYRQLSWAAARFSAGYYGWRSGELVEFPAQDDIMVRPPPESNAGSVALEYFFAFYPAGQVRTRAFDQGNGLPAVYSRMFGDPWEWAKIYDPLLPAGLTQPDLILPFEPGRLWSFTSGPHVVWETEGAMAALDFAPASGESGCVQSDAWVVAMANGPVVRSEFGAVVQDLAGADGTPADGLEQTGWAILYLHIDNRDQVQVGTYLHTGDPLGHPSCEGGRATGTHVHIARKYNGEWMLAAGGLPFILEGWVASAGSKPLEGSLTRGGQTVIAHPYGSYVTKIIRPTVTPTPVGGG
jgi:LasA protease